MNWTTATHGRIMHVAQHMRAQDRAEVFASHGATPEDAVMQSWRSSLACHAIAGDDGEPVGLAGVSTGGRIWLLATDGLLSTPSHRRQFVRGAKMWVDALVGEGVGPLHNWALARNRVTLRWLESLGFTIEPPAPMGPRLELFCYFERRS
jgi:hypothetical protein